MLPDRHRIVALRSQTAILGSLWEKHDCILCSISPKSDAQKLELHTKDAIA
uniref:Uncharacterized protein n=1 Tax=Anguilla anguilla TaxID=7936 RepID=A0A0E9PSW2_ANGAN